MSIKETKNAFVNSNIDNLLVLCGEHNYSSAFSDFEEINIGESLAKELLEYSLDQRKKYVESSIEKIIAKKKSSKLLIKNIELIFNPNYKIDILKLFLNIERNKKIAIIWPGYKKDDELIYSETSYEDYIKYKISNYNIKTV